MPSLFSIFSKNITLPGFQKAGPRWIKSSTAYTLVIEPQKSRFNTKDEISFSLNIGIYVPGILEMIWDLPGKKSINIDNCLVKSPIGAFSQSDTEWYKITQESDAIMLAHEIDKVLRNEVLPFFDNISSLEDVLQFMHAFRHRALQKDLHILYVSCLEIRTGHLHEAQAHLQTLLDTVWSEKALPLLDHIQA